MSNLIRQPHEISLWDDVLTAVDAEGREYENFVNADEAEIVAQYYKEKKLCVISSYMMDSPAHIVDPCLVRKTDGTNTLTFSIFAKYLDEQTGDFVENPFLSYLTNERKVKLKYYPNGELRWLDFVIKKIDESSENYKFTYTAIDLFINELSKTGYNLEFDMELENNQGTINELAESILDGTDWAVGANTELMQQTSIEALYAIELEKDIVAHNIFTNEEAIIPTGSTIYTFYSTLTNQNYDYFQFIYDPNNKYTADEDGVLYDVGSYYVTINDLSDISTKTPEYINEYRGERYVRSPQSKYDPILGRYVNVYNDGTVYGYTNSQYISPALVANYITNGASIVSDTGWAQQKTIGLNSQMFPTYEEVTQYDANRIFGLEYVQEVGTNEFLMNSGFKDNAEKIGQIAKTDSFIFRIKGGLPVQGEDGLTKELKLNDGQNFKVEVDTYYLDTDGKIVRNNNVLLVGEANREDDDGYYYTSTPMTALRAVSLDELTNFVDNRFGIFISVEGDGTYYIQEAQLFQCVKDGNENIILPNAFTINLNTGAISKELASAYVDTTYYYYSADQVVTDASQIEYIYTGKRALDIYRPAYITNFEKIRSITAKETNRFNLLQSLSETFESWCRFAILHTNSGEIALGRDVIGIISAKAAGQEVDTLYTADSPYSEEELTIIANMISSAEDAYRQQKFVSFHKRIGQQKEIGFVYGINLKSIARTLDSNDIATKLIVKNNNNQYATAGSCSIARADANPSGENFVLNFSHYIRQGLLNYKNVQNDLYSNASERGWIGLYLKLKNLNNERDILITKQSSLVGQYSKYKSDYETSKLLYDSTTEELRNQLDYYYDLTRYEYGQIEELPEIEEGEEGYADYQDAIGWLTDKKTIAIALDIERLKVESARYKQEYINAQTKLEEVNLLLEEIGERLTEIEELTSTLIHSFEQKYSRFIQEASWISEDYTDDNLYFFDAESTLHNAAQPKVTYTINLVELSALEGYENYKFDLGDITYVQDPDFFGWVDIDGIKTPYKEEVLITESVIYFNSPEKNVVKAKNYRDSFQDMFQRLAATSQQLQFYSGAYERAADAVNPGGKIAPQALSDAFANNAYILSNVANQSVKWDEYGITTTDTTNPAEIVKITSGGIYLTEDGGDTWTTGINAKGINAKTIKTGQLDTGEVTIMSRDQTAFRWDEDGISAYKEVPDGMGGYKRSGSTYVRFDEHGLYGIQNNPDYSPADIQDIQKNSLFSLTWDGLTIGKNGYGLRANADGITVGKSMNITEEEISIGEGFKATTNGLKIADWEINQDHLAYGNIGKENSMYLSPSGVKYEDTIAGSDKRLEWKIAVGNKFGVDTSGNLYANDAHLQGYIDANTGKIGGVHIENNSIASSRVGEAVLYADNIQATVKANTQGGEIVITNWNSSGWYNRFYDISQLTGMEIMVKSSQSTRGNSEIYILSSYPNGNGIFSYLARYVNTSVTFEVPEGAAYLLINRMTQFTEIYPATITITNTGGFSLNSDGTIQATAGEIGAFMVTKEGLQAGETIINSNGISGELFKGDVQAKNVQTGLLDFNGISSMAPGASSETTAFTYTISYSAAVSVQDAGNYKLVATATSDKELKKGQIFSLSIKYKTGLSTRALLVKVAIAAGATSGSNADIDWDPSWTLLGLDSNSTTITQYVGSSGATVNMTGSFTVPSGSSLTVNGVFANNSDVNLKTEITPLTDKYETLFDNLRPRSYEFIDAPDATRIGFIAQDVQTAIEQSGLSEDGLQLVHRISNKYVLAYLEFIALNTWQIQKLKTRVSELEEKLAQLEAKLS